jgi:hypothetical protein
MIIAKVHCQTKTESGDGDARQVVVTRMLSAQAPGFSRGVSAFETEAC